MDWFGELQPYPLSNKEPQWGQKGCFLYVECLLVICFLWGNSLSSEKCTVLLHNHSFFYIKVTKKEEISKFEFSILCPILNAFFLFKMLIIICYRWTIDENKYFILGRGLKGTQILKYCIFGRHIEFLMSYKWGHKENELFFLYLEGYTNFIFH